MTSRNLNRKNFRRLLFSEPLEQRIVLSALSFELERLFVPDVSNIREIIPRDINQDGLLDLVVMGDEVIWLRNDGNGEFTKQAVSGGRILNETLSSFDLDESTSTMDIVVMDVDMDGDDDVLSAYEQRVVWSENVGGGEFEDHPEWLSSQLPVPLGRGNSGGDFFQVVDLDADEDLDILVANNNFFASPSGDIYSADLFWYEQTTAATFAGPQHLDRMVFPFFDMPVPEDEQAPLLHTISVADLDGDSLMDVVVAGRKKTAWYRNEGGTFTERVLIEDPGALASAVPLDVDADGDVDLVTGSGQWLENDGHGEFSTSGSDKAERVHAAWMVDLDEDGVDEVITALTDAIIIGQPATGSQTQVDVTRLTAAGIADLDGDGDEDLLYARDNEILWQANGGTGDFFDPQFLFQPDPPIDPEDPLMGLNPTGEIIEFTDFNGDGLDDVLTRIQPQFQSQQANAELKLYINQSEHFSSPITVFSESSARLDHVLALDLDQDSDLDLLVTKFVNNVETLLWIENLSEQNGEFGGPIEITLPNNIEALGRLFSLDADLDGDLDVITTQVWIENVDGKGEFRIHDLREVTYYSIRSVARGDVTGDGHPDLVAVSEFLPDVELIRPTVNGPILESVWRGPAGFHVTTDFITISLTDFDGDGDLDGLMTYGFSQVTVPSSGKTHFVWLENKNGKLTQGVELGYRLDGVVTDYDGDGDQDLIYDSVVLVNQSITRRNPPGDATGDGKVDFYDFLILVANYGRTGDLTNEDGDFDGDGEIGLGDFLILANSFGRSQNDAPIDDRS